MEELVFILPLAIMIFWAWYIKLVSKDSFNDVVRKAISFGTTIVIERDGKTVEVTPCEFRE
jgi:hypothetical protein